MFPQVGEVGRTFTPKTRGGFPQLFPCFWAFGIPSRFRA
jgi:hypothetical protein